MAARAAGVKLPTGVRAAAMSLSHSFGGTCWQVVVARDRAWWRLAPHPLRLPPAGPVVCKLLAAWSLARDVSVLAGGRICWPVCVRTSGYVCASVFMSRSYACACEVLAWCLCACVSAYVWMHNMYVCRAYVGVVVTRFVGVDRVHVRFSVAIAVVSHCIALHCSCDCGCEVNRRVAHRYPAPVGNAVCDCCIAACSVANC